MRAALVVAAGLASLVAATPAVAQDGVVRDGAVRLQVISPTLIRLEYAADGIFEDRPTMLAYHRHAGRSPTYEARIDGDRLEVVTGRISVIYRRGSGPFTDRNLLVRVRRGDRTVTATPRWDLPGYQPPAAGFTLLGYTGTQLDRSGPRTSGNLGGWARSLDSQSEARVLHDGLLSREGWTFIDDTRNVLLEQGGARVAARPAHGGGYQDGYLFGYGHEYATALADYRRLSGGAPLLPRKAFGVWFSRYHPYSEGEYREQLLPAFRRERVPLDVLMVDTDFKAPHAWNGWNWQPRLFADPKRFFAWARGEGLAVGMNVHPSIALTDPRFAAADRTAGGLIGPAVGPAVAGLGVEPAGLLDVHYTFDWAQPRHLQAYFDLHEPFERDGADFWWLDWCCEEARAGPLIPDGTLSGDAWINAAYARRSEARGLRWPVLSRIGASFEDWIGNRPGPWGEQRSAIHFTGDAVSTFKMLDFQTRFTVAEGNTGLPYVSHDIGGFQGASLPDELYVRWIQAAAFQPILRLHSSVTGDVRRLPWEFGDEARAIAADFLRLRESLIPYLYTLARDAHDSGLPLARGMYLQWPGHDAAYEHDRQFMLGDRLLVAPVGAAGDPAAKRVWFPPGEWVDIFTGDRHRGPAAEDLRVPLGRSPVFARTGAIIARDRYAGASDKRDRGRLELHVYAGRSGSFDLYEDAGDGLAYRDGAFARSRLSWNERRRTVTIGRARGRFPGRVATRAYDIRLYERNGTTRRVRTGRLRTGRESRIRISRRRAASAPAASSGS